jgi:hypothetical protein
MARRSEYRIWKRDGASRNPRHARYFDAGRSPRSPRSPRNWLAVTRNAIR